MPGPEMIVGALIAVASLAAAARFALLRRGLAGWLVAGLSLVSGVLLWLTLFPPMLPILGEILLVATAETPATIRAKAGERLVALPEAPAIAGAERVPDLSTALRRHGQVQAIRILGRGLPPRDRETPAGVPVQFRPLPSPRGLVRLDPPADTPAGSVFALGGEAAGLAGGMAELLDPAGQKVDASMIGAEGKFTLGAAARAPGLATFTLRLRGPDKAIVSDTPVPLRTLEPPPVPVALIGSPSPEAKYLRRWAEDAGFELSSRLDAGAGVDIGGTGAVRLDAASLRDIDVVIIDDLALAGLGSGGRAALAQAVTGGLGVVVRMTAPATASMRQTWRTLGLAVEGGSEIEPVALPPLASDAETLALRRGPGSADQPEGLNTPEDPAPDLGRWAVRGGADLVAAVADGEGALIAGWQQRGQGRVMLWTVPNSYALVLGGEGDRYAQWWSQSLSAVARPEGQFRLEVPPLPRTGERMAVCGLTGPAQVTAPDGNRHDLVVDPAAGAKGCAALWPAAPGVHVVTRPAQGQAPAQSFAFLVLPRAALSGIAARETGVETMRWAAAQGRPEARSRPEQRGAAWPFLLGWLVVSGALWLLERRLRAREPGFPQTRG
jgi:hypothetical protein